MTPTVRAALWMIGSIVSFTTMAVAGRSVGASHDTFEIMLYRSLTGIVLVLAAARWAGTLGAVGTARIGLHTIRNLMHFAGQNLWFLALTLIPLAQVFALEFTSPIWAMVLTPLLLRDRLTRTNLISGMIGFAGILIVTRPSAESINLGVAAAAGAAIFFAITNLLTRRLTQDQSLTTILVYLTVMQAVFGLISAGVDGDIAPPTRQSAPWLFLIGCAGLAAHTCLTNALRLAPATLVMPIDFARLPLIAVIGVLFFNEALDPLLLLGAAVIFCANYLNLWKAARDRRAGVALAGLPGAQM